MNSSEFQIRLATTDDAKRILKIYSPYVTESAISFEETPPSIDEMKSRISKAIEKYSWIVAVDLDSNVVGYAYGAQHRERAAYRWAVDVAVYIDRDFQRRGLGKALYRELLERLRLRGYFRVFAGVTLPNRSSIALHERLGFQQIGIYCNVGFKMGKWHDVSWWELALQDSVGQPSEPT